MVFINEILIHPKFSLSHFQAVKESDKEIDRLKTEINRQK